MDSKFQPRIHPCVCGFIDEKYSVMKKHHKECTDWKNRLNPVGMMVERRKATKLERAPEGSLVAHCSLCHQRQDHHDSSCPNSQQEKARRDLILKHGINPQEFDVFLRLLAKRYPPYAS